MSLSSTEWKLVRAQVIQRDNSTCVECGIPAESEDVDVHHLLPRSAGGADDPSNLVTLCDGCHAAHHPKLAGSLARRAMECWAVRLARWLDREGEVVPESQAFGPLLRLFGLDRFKEGQLPIIQAALTGRSLLVVSPTGFGKTLCFQLPAVVRKSVSIVVSPLKALMGEQVSSLLRRKIPASFINSDLDPSEKRLRYQLLSKGSFKLLYAAPERFFVRSQAEQQVLRTMRPSFLVIDEAHCVDQWGRDFRPEYGRLKEVREALGSPPILAFTATAGTEMQQRILHSLGIPDAQVFVRGVDRPNIALLRWRASIDKRPVIIADICRLSLPSNGKLMIFVPTRKIGEALQAHLAGEGLETPFYHSQLGNGWEREQLLKRFVGDSRPVVDRIICTSAFGMGLDVPNVRMVVHWQHPASIEDYLQEFGRAGRDGAPSIAVLLQGEGEAREDIGLLRYMAQRAINGAGLSDDSAALALRYKHNQIAAMAKMAGYNTCFRAALVGYFKGPEKPVRKSIATRIMEWVFADARLSQSRVACCDACHQAAIVKQGKLNFIRKVIGS
ncbi:MAG: RecQ family ATP-dependent DNA helicase [Afipia sp.]|uniref:RecQ family ATP-dependent DNA helicase n=1 Tax=Afipia sp. DC4300-2b1 TaxID=2804672 RepID=UPI003CF76003|nr:RecQ family ATP-dependent DNA helicase [Afipia sp.]